MRGFFIFQACKEPKDARIGYACIFTEKMCFCIQYKWLVNSCWFSSHFFIRNLAFLLSHFIVKIDSIIRSLSPSYNVKRSILLRRGNIKWSCVKAAPSNLSSISSTFYVQLLRSQIPKACDDLTVFFYAFGSVKAVSRT